MVTVFGILNLTEDSFFDESRRLDPAGAVTAAIEMLRVGSDVVDVGPAASHPDARPVSPADEIRRIAPLLDALSDQMHRVSIDSFQPETQRYALKRGVGYLNDIQGFPDPALYPDIAEADCRLVVMHSAQRDGIATRTGHLRPEDALDEIVRFFEARVSALRRSGVAADRLILDPGMDRRLVHGETADLAPTGFGQQVREAMDQRREHHIEQRDASATGTAESSTGAIFSPPCASGKLRAPVRRWPRARRCRSAPPRMVRVSAASSPGLSS